MTIHCINCNNSKTSLYLKSFSIRFTDKKNYNLFECNKCRIIFTDFQDENYDKLYGQNYYKQNLIGKLFSFVSSILIILRLKFYHKSTGNILDFGSGSGEFLRNIKNYSNFGTYGIEISSNAYANLVKEFGNNISNKDIRSMNPFNIKFDVVTIFHVLEHLPDPKEYLISIHNLMKENSILLIEVPNINSLESKLFGKYFFHLDLPRHIYHFNQHSLKNFLTESGFHNIRYVYSFSFFSFLLCPVYSYENFVKDTNNNIIKSLLKIIRIFVYPILLFFSLITRITNSGPSISVICKK